MDNDTDVHQILAPFIIIEDDAFDVRHFINNCEDSYLLERFYEILGESELQLAYAIHLVEERVKALSE